MSERGSGDHEARGGQGKVWRESRELELRHGAGSLRIVEEIAAGAVVDEILRSRRGRCPEAEIRRLQITGREHGTPSCARLVALCLAPGQNDRLSRLFSFKWMRRLPAALAIVAYDKSGPTDPPRQAALQET